MSMHSSHDQGDPAQRWRALLTDQRRREARARLQRRAAWQRLCAQLGLAVTHYLVAVEEQCHPVCAPETVPAGHATQRKGNVIHSLNAG